MSFQATIIQIMISSPSDLNEERAIAVDAINEWNSTHAFHNKVFLMPVTWENNVTSEFGAHPQNIINKQILEKSDILIGMFWSRIGTATQTEISGSVEEINKHLSAGKHCMIYFSERNISPSKIDAAQWEGVSKFKKWCGDKGVYKSFSDPVEFKSLITKEIASAVIKFKDNHLQPTSIEPSLAQITQPVLSKEAKTLLFEAAKDISGRILKIRLLGGTLVQTNGIAFSENATPREAAKWDAALDTLEDLGFLKVLGSKREFYEVTAAGYEYAENLSESFAHGGTLKDPKAAVGLI